VSQPEQVEQVRMPARLLAQTLGGIDDEARRVGMRSARHHVLDELAMPGRVDQDVFARGRAEPRLRRVDRDVLIALALERVGEVGELERGAAPPRNRLELLELAVGQRSRIEQQAADERRFPVIDVADDDELDLRGHAHM
jgi:hypothetical protein